MQEQKRLIKYHEISCDQKKLWVRLNESSLNKAIDLCRQAGKVETGGVITGYYSKSRTTCTIEDLHPPTKDSKHEWSSFVSGIKGLSELFRKLWTKQEYYIGEWHFHPENSPTPSLQDKRQLKEISKNEQLQCKFPLMIIIGQSKNKFIFSITGYSRSTKYVEFSVDYY